MTVTYGLLGEHLSHSFSPLIHNLLADYDYQFLELPPEQIADFLQKRDFRGLNVTIPYKKTVMSYCDELTEAAASIGSVNTLILNAGKLMGDNTDMGGFIYMTQQAGVTVADTKVLVLGSGGASAAAVAACRQMKAGEIVVVSRSGQINYANVAKIHPDAQIIINATPCGMFPNNQELPLDITAFSQLCGVLDMIYNPLRTKLVLQAQERGIPACGGLPMLVEQARLSAERFCGQNICQSRSQEILDQLMHQMANIVLLGMPGCGKTTIGRKLAALMDREFVDMDEYIHNHQGLAPADIIRQQGEAAFRLIEKDVALELGKRQGLIISCGGGTVTIPEGMTALAQNGRIFMINRPLAQLPVSGRPLSSGEGGVAALWQQRKSLYEKYSEISIMNDSTPEAAAKKIYNAFAGTQAGGQTGGHK